MSLFPIVAFDLFPDRLAERRDIAAIPFTFLPCTSSTRSEGF